MGGMLFSACSSSDSKSVPVPVVVIGSQTWMLKNLDVTTYSDGTVIQQVTDPAAWTALTTGAWCYYENATANGTVYGKLYNWYAVAGIWDEASKTDPTKRKKLAPTGYHVPTDAEWTVLTTFLGGVSVAGGQMKATTLWDSPNTEATNSSGFTGLPGGYRNLIGAFYNIGSSGYWWSSSQYDNTNARSHFLKYDFGNAVRDYVNKRNGYSVRCLRD